jgi:hypothetical protein
MSRRVAVCLLILAVSMWAAGASVFLFAESWWRMIGIVLFSFAIPLAILAGRALRRRQELKPSR